MRKRHSIRRRKPPRLVPGAVVFVSPPMTLPRGKSCAPATYKEIPENPERLQTNWKTTQVEDEPNSRKKSWGACVLLRQSPNRNKPQVQGRRGEFSVLSISSQEGARQSWTTFSRVAATSVWPSGENLERRIHLNWPGSVATSRPMVTSQILISLSGFVPQVARRAPSGEKHMSVNRLW